VLGLSFVFFHECKVTISFETKVNSKKKLHSGTYGIFRYFSRETGSFTLNLTTFIWFT
jgi:hypothetical protein